MEVINIMKNDAYLFEYIKLCNLQWGKETN